MGKIICGNLYNVILRLPKAAEESNIYKILRSLRSLRMTGIQRLLRPLRGGFASLRSRHSPSLRSGSWLLAMTVCLVLLSASSFAEVYITADEAIRKIFPSLEKYEQEIRMLDSQEARIFIVHKQNDILGWAVALDEMGKIKPITFLIGIDNQHKVLAVYILEYRDLFGSEIKRRSFLRQFIGKTLKDRLKVGRDIDAVTSATISSNAAVAAVKKALKITEGL